MLFNVNDFRQKIRDLPLTENKLLSPMFRDDNLTKQGNNIIVLHAGADDSVSCDVITPEVAEKEYRIRINYRGKNSAIVIWDDLCLKACSVTMGENGLIYLGRSFKSRHSVNINLSNRNGTICFGDNCNVGNMNVYAGDEKNLEVVVGDRFLSALNLELRASDGHTIYDLDNPDAAINKPVFGIHVANHVWIGMNVFVGKDVIIPSDCIVGAGSLVTKKRFKPNCVIAGTPAAVIRENVNWDERTITRFEQEKKKKK